MIWGGGRFFSTVRSLQDLLKVAPEQAPGEQPQALLGIRDWVLVMVGGSHSRHHSPKDLFPCEHTPPFVRAAVATAPETQPV